MSNTTRSTNSSSSSGTYDERFVVPLEASRRGAHRARVSPVMAALPVAAVVGIVVGAIALVYVLFGGLGGGSDTTAQPPASSPAAAPTSSGPAAVPSSSPADGAGAGTPTSVVPGTVDKTIPVAVFNGSGTSGLGRRAGDKLIAGGWKVGSPQTWTGAPVQVTTVYYGAEDQRASAVAIVKILKRGTVRMSASVAKAGITVVVGPDYPKSAGQSSSRTRSSRGGTGATHSPGEGTAPTKTSSPSGTKAPSNSVPVDPTPQDPTAPAAGGSTPTPSATSLG